MHDTVYKRDEDDNGGGGGGRLSLPDDIILEVLVRLPTNALCRFRCVSKGWRAFISHPDFVAAQRSRAGPLIVAMFVGQGQELRLMDKDGNVLRVFNLRGSTAKLAPTRLDLVFVDRAPLGVMIIDPASGRDFTVFGTNDPPPPLWVQTSMWSSTFISDYSFGRAAASGDYKVLRLVTSPFWFRPSQWCEVATIMDDGAEPTWRQRPWGPFVDGTFSCEDKATVNGVLYFLPCKTNSEHHARSRIATFVLETEEWKSKMIKCPPLEPKEDDASHTAITELKGTLCMVQHMRRHLASLRYVNILLLMDPNGSIWVKTYRIQMPERILFFIKPLNVLGDVRILLLLKASSLKVGNFRYTLKFYNSRSEDFSDFLEMPDGFNGTMTFYRGSLLS